jgi:hypothetical protein
MKNTKLYIYLLMVLSFLLVVIEVALNLQGKSVSNSTNSVWSLMFFVTTIFWAYYDADREDFNKPFDFGLFIYIFWPVAFPWYLLKTRGTDGSLMLLGFLVLWLGPWLAGLVTYVYFS